MRKIIEVIIGPMNFLGVNPVRRDSYFAGYFRIFLVIVAFVYESFVTVMFSLHSQSSDFNSLVVPLPYGLVAVVAVTIVITTHRSKRSLSRVLRSIDANVFVYPDEEEICLKYSGLSPDERCSKVRIYLIMFAFSGFVFAIFSPFIGFVLNGRLRTYMFPQWVPWKTDTQLAYLLAYMLQIPVLISLFAIYYMILTYFVFVLFEFGWQCRKLKHAIKTLDERSRKRLIQESDGRQNLQQPSACVIKLGEERDRVFRSNLIECIRHYQILFQLFKIFKTFYQIVFSLELTMVTLSFALLLYCLVVEPDFERGSSLVGASWLRISNLFLRCFVGEKFSEMHLGIRNTLFAKSGWHDQSSENRKLILIFHSLTQRPFTLKGFGIFNSSYYVFCGILRLSYSYLNLLQASRR